MKKFSDLKFHGFIMLLQRHWLEIHLLLELSERSRWFDLLLNMSSQTCMARHLILLWTEQQVFELSSSCDRCWMKLKFHLRMSPSMQWLQVNDREQKCFQRVWVLFHLCMKWKHQFEQMWEMLFRLWSDCLSWVSIECQHLLFPLRQIQPCLLLLLQHHLHLLIVTMHQQRQYRFHSLMQSIDQQRERDLQQSEKHHQ